MATTNEFNQFDWTSMIEMPQQQPSPLSSVQGDDDELWFKQLLSKPIAIGGVQPPAAAVDLSSFLSFNDNESIFSSDTSLNNSPVIKTEDKLMEVPTDLQQLSSAKSSSVSSVSSDPSIESVFDTKDILTDATPDDSKKAPKKKRAPRKRLTAHQKQAHNKIEKRYRININAKIAGLQSIIPWVASEKTAFETGGIKQEDFEEEVMEPAVNPGSDESPKLNKSMILEKATAYILYLKDHQIKMNLENERLREEIRKLGGGV